MCGQPGHLLAIVLAAIGVYGVLAAAVAGRTRELGIRTALGADPRRLVNSVMAEGFEVAAIAISARVVLAWTIARSFSIALFCVAGSTAATRAGAAAIEWSWQPRPARFRRGAPRRLIRPLLYATISA